MRKIHFIGKLINGEYTICGKTSRRSTRVGNDKIKLVTCQLCLEEIKKKENFSN